MNIPMYTPIVYLFPHPFLDTREWVSEIDFYEWSDNTYRWEQDEWNGWLDYVSPPQETYSTGRGDCDDYAIFAASVVEADGADDTAIAWCFEEGGLLPEHMVAIGWNNVYSSGTIHTNTTMDEYVEQSEYDWYTVRKI